MAVCTTRDGSPLAGAALARVRATLRCALNAAVRAGVATDNPARFVELPAVVRPHAVVWTADRVELWRQGGRRPRVAVWTAAQTAAFLTRIREHRLYAAYHLIALRGLRRGEAAGLRWCDLDLEQRTASIHQQVQRYEGVLVACPPKTAHSMRTIALDATTVAVLRRHRARQDTERIASGEAWHHTGYVFARRDGDPVSPETLTRTFRALVAETGLPPVRLHDLRHGAASLALAAGADLKVVQDTLGHASIVLTADTYTWVLPEIAHRVAADTAALIRRAGRLVPGTDRPRRPESRPRRRTKSATLGSGGRKRRSA